MKTNSILFLIGIFIFTIASSTLCSLDSLFSVMPDIHLDPDAYNDWKIEYAYALQGEGHSVMERPSEPMEWWVQNGFISAYIDEATGEFEEGGDLSGSGSYSNLTYSYPYSPGTGWIIYYVDGNTGKTSGTLPNTSSSYLLDNTAYSVWDNWNGVYIRQEITTMSLGGIPSENEQVKFKTIMKPADGSCHEVGCLVFYDTMLDTDDAAEISTAYGYTGIAEIFYGFGVPAIWRAYEGGYPPTPWSMTALGILIGFEATTPDVFWYGSWGSATSNGWDDSEWVADLTGTFGDSATMVKWYPRTVCEGDSAVFVTYYGIGEITAGLDLTINAGTPVFATGCLGITPNPFTLDVLITNPGATSATDVEVFITLPPGLSLTGGTNPQYLGELSGYGGSRLVSWSIAIDSSAYGHTACYDIEVDWEEGGPIMRTYCPIIPNINSFSVDIDAEFTSICNGDNSQLRAVLDTVEAPDRIWSYLWKPTNSLTDSTSPVTSVHPETSTTYWVIASDGIDCIDSASITIIVNEYPIVELKDTTICLGHSCTITPDVTPNIEDYTFIWIPDGDTTREISVSPTTTTRYEVVVISPAGCFSSDSAYVYVIECASPWSVLIDPFDGAWTSCADQDIRLTVDDEGEVDTMSIRFTVNDVTYSIDHQNLSIFEDSILIYTPLPLWDDGDVVSWSLDSLSNDLRIATSPSELPAGTFYVDLTPPDIFPIAPSEGAVLGITSPSISFSVTDNLSGLDSSLVTITINEYTFLIGTPGIDCLWLGDTLHCVAECPELGVWFFETDTVFVQVSAGDMPDYCSPNPGSFSWWFLIELETSCNRYPNPITPNNDGINDAAVFDYPDMFSGSAELSIFNTRNILVYRENIGPASDFSDVSNRVWDCKDSDGNPVRDGLYIYVIERDGRVICNGTLIMGR
ncbi:gliding motility-associated C-terminal domain-containing protein [bacterium]|nr:gliding motility-associated C-terminal domain-containing protein [bacterium]